jgi:hypothetical protein
MAGSAVMTTKLTAERCDECIHSSVYEKKLWIDVASIYGGHLSPDEAELFAYRLLVAVKRARGE